MAKQTIQKCKYLFIYKMLSVTAKQCGKESASSRTAFVENVLKLFATRMKRWVIFFLFGKHCFFAKYLFSSLLDTLNLENSKNCLSVISLYTVQSFF